jgi:hypothetical protein
MLRVSFRNIIVINISTDRFFSLKTIRWSSDVYVRVLYAHARDTLTVKSKNFKSKYVFGSITILSFGNPWDLAHVDCADRNNNNNKTS